MTALDLIAATMRTLGVLATGESPTSEEATEGLAALNRMLDSWSTEGLLVFAITEEAPLTLTGGDATYTLGAAGDITTRPITIEKALIRDGSTDYPIRLLSLDEYARIPDKSVRSTHPDRLYDDGGYPQRTLTLYPVPASAVSLILWTKRALSQIATQGTSLSLPPGYERALVYNLAIDLAPEYGKPLREDVASIAVGSKADIKRANKKIQSLSCDAALLVRGGRFDIATGGYR